MATSDEAKAYAADQRRIIDSAGRALALWLAATPDATPDHVVEFMLALVGQFARATAEHAAAWYTQLRQRAADRNRASVGASRFERLGVPNFAPTPVDAFDAGSIVRDTLWALKQKDPAASLAQVADQHVAQGGKDTIAVNAEQDPARPRWARMPVGVTCAWCLMLAGRGAAYASRRTAEYAEDGTKYHANDDCTPVPAWDDVDLPYDADELYQVYLDAREKVGGDPNRITAQIRRDRWDQVTDGVVPDPKPEDFYDRSVRPEYWDRRVAALGIDYGADVAQIRPEEIITAERLVARGDNLTHILTDRGGQPKATSDYDWFNAETGVTTRVEIKSLRHTTELHRATIPLRTKKAVGKSLAHGEQHRKRDFLFDIGERQLTPEVEAALRSYNRETPLAQIERFFILSRGRIIEIVPE